MCHGYEITPRLGGPQGCSGLGLLVEERGRFRHLRQRDIKRRAADVIGIPTPHDFTLKKPE